MIGGWIVGNVGHGWVGFRWLCWFRWMRRRPFSILQQRSAEIGSKVVQRLVATYSIKGCNEGGKKNQQKGDVGRLFQCSDTI